MKVLVTGASGFIGRRAVSALAATGAQVVAASRRPLGDAASVSYEAVDLLQPGAAQGLIERTAPTHLLHLAWNATPGHFWRAPDNLDWSATTLQLMRAFAECGGRRAVFAGTCAEYAWDQPVLSEDTAPAAATFYGRIKDATRAAVCAAGEALNVSTGWGRVFWLYGPREQGNRLVSDVASALVEGRTAECSEGLQARDFLHVDDVAGAFVSALNASYDGVFNIGSGEATPVRDVVTRLAAAIGRADLLDIGARPSPPNDAPSLRADATILREKIGFQPRFSLQAGLEDTAAWWLTTRA